MISLDELRKLSPEDAEVVDLAAEKRMFFYDGPGVIFASGRRASGEQMRAWVAEAGYNPLTRGHAKEHGSFPPPEPSSPAHDTRYVARFIPQVRVDGVIKLAAPEGPREWDCTAFARRYARYLGELQLSQASDDTLSVVDVDEVFRNDSDAPEWVRTWRGPFTIYIREAP